MVKTLSAHLTRKNSKYPPQKSQPKLPTLNVKTVSAHLNPQNSKYPPQKSQGENLKSSPQWSKL